MIYCEPRSYNSALAGFWGIMAIFWIYDLKVNYTPFDRTHKHTALAVLLCMLPLAYPLFSIIRGMSFPMMTSPVMPCSVAVFTIGLLLAFSKRVNIFLVMFLCHWALIGLSKVYFFGIPEDYLLACSTVPALYIFFREYVRSNADRPTKPSAHVLDALLIALSLVVGISLPSRSCTNSTYSPKSSDLYAHAQTNILPLQWTRADKPAHNSILPL